jgi:small GTP-binding protein
MSKKQKKDIEDSKKIITLGESGVGKTSIIRRYIHNIFDENNLSTIGLNFSFKEVKLKDGNTINLKLIDTAGQEKYKALAKSYFKNVDAVLFVFAINSQESFDNIRNWVKLFNDNHNGKAGIPKYLIGNKSDEEREVKDSLVQEFKDENKDYKYYETSAKNNTGIEKLFQEIGEDLYNILSEKEGRGRSKSQNAIKISKYNKNKNKNNGSNCPCTFN